MSWKFWKWFHRGEVLQQSAKSAENSRGNSAASRISGSHESEDILGSISELIEGRTDEGGVVVPPIRATESFRFTEVIRAVETINSSEADQNTQEIEIRSGVTPIDAHQASLPAAIIQPISKVSEKRDSPPAEKPAAAKPVRETTPSKRADPPKEIMKTLVVEDGHWPMKGLSETFKDLDNDDDLEDPDRGSPFKTIMPNDE